LSKHFRSCGQIPVSGNQITVLPDFSANPSSPVGNDLDYGEFELRSDMTASRPRDTMQHSLGNFVHVSGVSLLRRQKFMFDRRRALQASLATLGSLPFASPFEVRAQGKPRLKIRYSEVVRSMLYAPAYVALTKGYFDEAGLDVTLTTAQGGDKSVAALLSGSADIALAGPEIAIYVQNSDSPTKLRIFCGLTTTDGFMLVSREKVDKFDWRQLRGKQLFALRPGSTPDLFLEAALRQNGIDPRQDVKLVNNIAIPARVGAWLAGQNDFAIFQEPDASQLELDGKAYFLASIGQTVGPADYTTFMATDKYIREHPEIIQTWTNAIYKAQKWTEAAPTAELVKVLEPYFRGIGAQALTAAVERYRRLRMWKTTPAIEPPAIEKFQDILVQGNVLEPGKRVKFAGIVLTEFAAKAK
jgi:NitT/TauT family transport system substrate-binding protein